MKCDKDADQVFFLFFLLLFMTEQDKQCKTMKNRLIINVLLYASVSNVGENYEIFFCTQVSVSVPMTDNSRSLVGFTSLLVLLKPAHL